MVTDPGPERMQEEREANRAAMQAFQRTLELRRLRDAANAQRRWWQIWRNGGPE